MRQLEDRIVVVTGGTQGPGEGIALAAAEAGGRGVGGCGPPEGHGQPFLTAYAASKGALANFTKNVAHALRRDRIRVNGINLGWTDTPNEDLVQKAEGAPADWLARAEGRQPFGRLIRVNDVAQFVV